MELFEREYTIHAEPQQGASNCLEAETSENKPSVHLMKKICHMAGITIVWNPNIVFLGEDRSCDSIDRCKGQCQEFTSVKGEVIGICDSNDEHNKAPNADAEKYGHSNELFPSYSSER